VKHFTSLAIVAVVLCAGAAGAQTIIFNENFDGGYTGSFGTSHYSGGSPTGTANSVLSSGGNPSGCWQETMTTTTSGDYYAGQVQLMSVSGNTDSNPNNYVLSFDAKGSEAANIQFGVQTWSGNTFGGSAQINATVNNQLSAANTWQTFHVNLGSITTASAAGATWQLNFTMAANQWGGAGLTDTLTVDNIVLTHLSNSPQITSSANPSTSGTGVTFTATVVTNGVAAGNATGTVVFSFNGVTFSTQSVSGGSAASAAITNLPVGSASITAVYSGGNYPASTNTFTQTISPPATGIASADLPLYTDELVNGFQDWSWATRNFQNSSPVHSGAYSISVNDAGNQGLVFMRPEFNSTPYTSFSFWANGGSTGGQVVQVWGILNDTNQVAYAVGPFAANTWQQITIPLSSLGVANKPNVTGFSIQGRSGGSQPTFYVDDVQLTGASMPAVVHLGANAGQTLQPVDARQFGLNTATWDGILGNSQTLPLLKQIGCMTLRWPGGSTSDAYNWASDPSGNTTFQNLAKNLGAQVFTTVNYGSGTAAQAAAWVLSANKTNNCGFKYWEVGNECYGSWETDNHAIKQDPYTYATNAATYIQQMKAAFPSVPIKVGIVVVPGEDSFSNNATHVVINPRTSAAHGGWTPVVLSTLKSLGVTPDFLIYHFYWQYTPSGQGYYVGSPDSDPLLLQVAGNPSPLDWSDWASAAASLRQQLTDYMGTGSSNVELCVTENNSDAGAMGRESTSVVNALYLADSTAQLMQTEFRSYIWWDLHNGADTTGNFDQTIYGWRSNGDYGILSGSNTPYPTFYTENLLESFARAGDSVLASASDNLLLSAYAVRRTNGALTMLVINKDMVTNLLGQITLTNFVPWSTATVQSYGVSQDEATRTNGPALSQVIATNTYASAAASFSYTFPPMSLTLFTFAPGPASLSVQAYQTNQIKLLLQGQPNTSYIIQSSPDLGHWNSVSTNALAGSSTNIFLPISPGQPAQFFRAVWQ
jgi:alpha-N-arabinofuranosidase